MDNLKLGYGGTKEEMERLVEDAEKLNESFEATRDENGNLVLSFGDVVDAIHIVQTEMGITGTTAKEASETISGSWSMVLGAWQNLLTGFANEDADVGELLDKVIDSVFTFGKNLVPRIKTIMSKMFDLAKEALPEFLSGLWENISKGITYIKDNMPIILAELPLLITGFFESSSDMLEIGFMIIQRITESIISSLPRILASATELISILVKGLADNMPQLINSAVEMIILIADALTRPETLIPLLDAALSVIVALADALYLIADNEALRTTTYQIMLNLADFLIEGIPLILSAAWDIIVALVSALAESFITNLETMPDLLDMFVKWLTDEERLGGIFDAGVDIIKKLMAGIVATLPMIKEEIEEFFNNLFNGEEKIGLSGDFSNLSGNSEIEFNKSGLAKVGSNTINAIESNSGMSNKTHPNSVNLVLPDGTKFAEYLLPDLEGVSRARGTPIVQPK